MRRLLIAICTLATAAGSLLAVSPAPAGAAVPSTLDVVGHGYGHGRGMGQWGAYGYALQGWSYQQILGHYYGGTTPAGVSQSTVIPVHLVELDGYSAVTVVDAAGRHSVTAGSPAFTPAGGVAWVEGSWSGGSLWRPFLGQIQVLSNDTTINLVPIEDYVQGVVPAESPASWGVNGEASLEAQAVAARSYALAYLGGSSSICDNTWCQMYVGDPNPLQGPDGLHAAYGSYVSYSNEAEIYTAGQILECGSDTACGAPTQVARTEFSSSTGGYTAGGAFPAVVDAGDSVSPYHTWTATIPTSRIQALFPSVGTLQSVTVTQRNGLGDLGGRVLQVVLQGGAGRITLTGSEFAADLGLRSDWFAFTNAATSGGGTDGYWVVASTGAVYPFG
ncbi:MAG: SpoIID/LytB domain-containing protein, partial [Acidimicrobiales bacterium]